MKKEKIIQLVNKINDNPERIRRGLYPLEYKDDGEFRIVFESYLDQYTFLPEGKLLRRKAIKDWDSRGIYYWIPYKRIPKGFTTPALRLARLNKND